MKETFEYDPSIKVHLITGNDVPREYLSREQLKMFTGNHVHAVIEVDNPFNSLTVEKAQHLCDAIKLNAIQEYEDMSLSLADGDEERADDMDHPKMAKSNGLQDGTWVLSLMSENKEQSLEALEAVMRSALIASGIPDAGEKPKRAADHSELISDKENIYSLAYVPIAEAISHGETTLGVRVHHAEDEKGSFIQIAFDITSPGADLHAGRSVNTKDFDQDRIAFVSRTLSFLTTAMDRGFKAHERGELPYKYKVIKTSASHDLPILAMHHMNIDAHDETHQKKMLKYIDRLLHEVEEKGLDEMEAELEAKLPKRPRSKVEEVQSVQQSGQRLLDRQAVEDVMNHLDQRGLLGDMNSAEFMRLTEEIHRELTGGENKGKQGPS